MCAGKLVDQFAIAALLLLLMTCHKGQASRAGPTRRSIQQSQPGGQNATPRRYLYPMLIYGANNRITGLKETLALGDLLNRTVIAHDIGILPYEGGHRSLLDHKHMFMDLKLLIDFGHLASRRSVVMLDDHLAAGWNGKLDAVVFFGDERRLQYYHDWVARSSKVSTDGAKVLNYGAEFIACDEQGIANLTQLFEPYNTVGLIIFDNVSPKAGYELVPGQSPSNLCNEAYYKVNADLRKSRMIKSIAKIYQQRHVGNDRYTAVHIRPFPDACLDLWRAPAAEFNYTAANKACHNPSLIRVFVNQTLDAIKRYNVSNNVFVMCHPGIRNIIAQLYGAAGLTPFFYTEDIMGPIFGFRGPALLGMVEQEICSQADVFLGTKASTMTGIVWEERFTADPPKLATLHFSGDYFEMPLMPPSPPLGPP